MESLETAPRRTRPSREEGLAPALSAIARAVAESMSLKDVFSRVAEAARLALPFDTMGVNVTENFDLPLDAMPEDEAFSVYSAVGTQGIEEIGLRYRRSDVSPRLRLPAIGEVVRHSDITTQLDASYSLDRQAIELGTRSLLVTLLPGPRPLGSIWFSSRETDVYLPEDEETILAIADLVSLALQHERLFRKEKERRQRSEALEALVPMLSKALDIREVFDQLSAAVAGILPHDRMALGLLSKDRQTVRIHAYSGERMADMPKTIPLDDDARESADWSFFLVADIRREPGCCTEKFELMKRDGIRSMLRVPIRLEGEIVGGLNFLSRNVAQFREEDADIARRIADQVALVLSHEQIAEEARIAAEAREEAIRLEGRVASLTEQLVSFGGARKIIGNSKSWREVLDLVSKVAPTEATVLLTGESGTGKEVVARAIHAASPRSGKPFLAINCAALPEQLLESELFGYERGAFTGALQSRAGKIEQAAGGVLVLDEVGEMSPSVQAKFLRVLQEREFQRLGGSRVQKADVRVIAATNRDITAALASGQFREDLYYRLKVFEIALPPLRERKEDILLLAESFVQEIAPKVGACAGISKEARDALLAYSWPGNVRELRNAIERAIILCAGGLITAAHLPLPQNGGNGRGAAWAATAGKSLEDVERELVENALKDARNNKAQAARLLGITRAQLYSRIQKYGIV
ncbi:MAG TPA: sigma 54-interacting transcriptional regulator [Thermoanaerobaculia bacterium]|nr:sigma 54-interacting transcriptional regulator [Thermoanaerobaculia bacterium]